MLCKLGREGAITRFAVIKRIGSRRRRLEWQMPASLPDLKLDLDARGVKPKIARFRRVELANETKKAKMIE